jgi:hypothetical protein
VVFMVDKVETWWVFSEYFGTAFQFQFHFHQLLNIY